MQTTIHQYVKKTVRGRHQTVGILVGSIDKKGIVHFGWSKTAVTRGDKFDKERGFEIANGRVSHSKAGFPLGNIPRSMHNDMEYFVKRCGRYFKDRKAMAPVEIQKPLKAQSYCKNYRLKSLRSLADNIKF